jgi:hypothetical protein
LPQDQTGRNRLKGALKALWLILITPLNDLRVKRHCELIGLNVDLSAALQHSLQGTLEQFLLLMSRFRAKYAARGLPLGRPRSAANI